MAISNANQVHAQAINIPADDTVGTQTTNNANEPITNAGTIAGNAITNGDNSPIINFGTILGDAVTRGTNSDINNKGIVDTARVDDNGVIHNSGTIISTTDINADNAAIKNTGTIGAEADISGNNGIIINRGTIIDFAGTDGDNGKIINSGFIGGGIVMAGADPFLHLLGGSVVVGAIEMIGTNTQTIKIGRGLNLNSSITGNPITSFQTNGAPLVQAGTQVTVVDPTGFAVSDIFVNDLTSSLLDGIGDGGRPIGYGVSTHGNTGYSSQHDGRQSWISGFGGFSELDGSATLVGVDHAFGGAITGMEMNDGTSRYGLFGGGAMSHLEVQFNSSETDVDSFFGGAYWEQDYGSHNLILALIAGITDHEVRRRVANNQVPGGIEIGRGDFNGWFVTPSATLSAPVDAIGIPAIGSLRANYTGLFLDGYTETGTTNPLTVAERDVHLLGTRVQLSLPHELVDESENSVVHVDIRFGAEGNFNLGPEKVTAAIANTLINFDGSADDEIFGFAGANFSRTSTDGSLVVSLSAEAQSSFGGSTRFFGELTATKRF